MQLRDEEAGHASEGSLVLWTIVLLAAIAVAVPGLELAGQHMAACAYPIALVPMVLGLLLPVMSRVVARRSRRSERGVSPLLAGAALGASALPASLVAILPGLLLLEGHDALIYGTSLMSGMVAASVLMASGFKASGATTIPEFLERRFGSKVALLGTLILASTCVLLLVAELSFAGLIFERGLGLAYEASIAAFAIVCAAAVLLSGVRGVSALQAALYAWLAAGLTIALLLIANAADGPLLALVSYGETLRKIASAEMQMLENGLADLNSFRQHTKPFLDIDELNLVALFVTLMAGAAALPHVVTRYRELRSTRHARFAGAWATLFVLILLITLPPIAAFAKLAIFKVLLGASQFDSGGEAAAVPNFDQWNAFKISALPAVAALGGNEARALAASALSGDPGAIVFLLPKLTAAPVSTAALIISALLAAALATTSGIASTLSDVISSSVRAARGLTAATVAAAALLAALVRPDPIVLVLAAFAIAAASLFPVLVLGLWWRSASPRGAGLGMAAGLALTAYYIAGTQLFPTHFYETWAQLSNASEVAMEEFANLKAELETADTDEARSAAALALDTFARGRGLHGGIANWFGVRSGAAALFGLPLGFTVMVLVSMLSPRHHRQV